MAEVASRLAVALSDRYVIERELGAGGMATVYLAHDVRHDRKVALKVLRPELSAILGGERFLKEIRTTANLQHPHILSLFDSGEADGTVFYVMPYVDGESLRDRLVREKQLPVDEAVRIAKEVAGALDYAHRHDVVHRDIKPENILLHDGTALVADFGIALAASRSDGGTRMTETGMSLGTPHYMSPEQAMGEREITPKADVYALGCVLYEMLTGEPPFTGPTAQAIIARVMTEQPRSLTLQRRTIPPHVEAVVQRALEKLPADRFASAAQFLETLEKPGFPAFSGAAAGSAHAPPVSRGRRLVSAVPWAVAGLATIAGVWALLRPEPSRPVVRYGLALPDSQQIVQLDQRKIAISPDGRLIAYVGPAVRGRGRQLWLRRRDALTATPLSGTDGASNPAFSPDGARIAFITGSPRALRVVALAGGTPSLLTDSLVDLGGVSWGHDGYIYYDGHLEGDGVARIRATGGRPEAFTQPNRDSGEAYHNLPFALPGGRGVLFAVRSGGAARNTWDVAVADVRSGRHTVLVRGVSPLYAATGHVLYLTDDGALMAAPFDERKLRLTGEAVEVANGIAVRGNGRGDVVLSREGTLVYGMGPSATLVSELVWVTREGGATVADPTWREAFTVPALSPDGRSVAVTLNAASSDVWVKRLGGGPPSRITFDGRSAGPVWTPDGRSVVFTSGPGTTRSETRIVPADGSALPRVLRADTSGMNSVSLSRDGQWLLFMSRLDLYAARLAGDTARRVLQSSPFVDLNPALSPDGRWVAYMSDETGGYEVYVRPFPDAEVARWQVTTEGGLFPAWSRDGRELFYQTLRGELVSVPVLPGRVFAMGDHQVLFSLAGYTGRNFELAAVAPAPDGQRFLMVRRLGGEQRDQLVVVEDFFDVLRGRAP